MLQFFKDHNDQFSMMRLQTFIVIITGCVYAFVYQDIAMVGMMFTYGFGSKAMQKHIESKPK